MTQRMLSRERVPHLVRDTEILIYGDDSEHFADLFHQETRRPMRQGVLNPDEPHSLDLIRQIVQKVAGHREAPTAKVCFGVPAPPLGSEDGVTYHEAAVRQLLGELGFQAMSINEGLAVIYAELESSNYTGIGISFGGGLCNVCLAYLSAPLFSFSVAKAGDSIDHSVASVTGELATRVRIAKEGSFHFNGNFSDKVKQALAIYYDDMIQAVLAGLKASFANAMNVPKIGRPIPVALSGGSALPQGFKERFEKGLSQTRLPVNISEVMLSIDPLNATAKGALVAAMCELE
jgi:hypothetical protein